MASSPDEFRARLKRRQLISVTIPGTDLVVDCWPPELLSMATSGLFQWPALQAVKEALKPAADVADGPILDNRPQPTLIDRARNVGTFLDEWVCAAAISPRFVLNPDEAVGDLLCVADLPYEGRVAIFNATMSPTPPTVPPFRGDQPDSAAAGPSGEAIRDTPVDAPESPG